MNTNLETDLAIYLTAILDIFAVLLNDINSNSSDMHFAQGITRLYYFVLVLCLILLGTCHTHNHDRSIG